MQHQDVGARGDFLTAAKLQSELIAMRGLSLKCPWSEEEGSLSLMPKMCGKLGCGSDFLPPFCGQPQQDGNTVQS